MMDVLQIPWHPQYIPFEWLYIDNSNTACTVSPRFNFFLDSIRKRATYGIPEPGFSCIGFTCKYLVNGRMSRNSRIITGARMRPNFFSSCIISIFRI
jgi:hypothetical protein